MNARLPEPRIHLIDGDIFSYRPRVYNSIDDLELAIAFQREVINRVVPAVQPDLIHCNDWMTGLIPAAVKGRGIKCLFTVHNTHTLNVTLAHLEDRGVPAYDFWYHCYYLNYGGSYEASRNTNPVDPLATGIFASDHVNVVSPTFLAEVVDGHHHFVPDPVRAELRHKHFANAATGILNAPDVIFDPASDPYLDDELHYGPDSHQEGKARSKARFQELVGLEINPDAPLFFWPSRLDPVQKGPQLLADILYEVMAAYHHLGLQVAFVADPVSNGGNYQEYFREITNHHGLGGRIAVRPFNEGVSHLGYAASDFTLMPSSYEPCGLPQMVSPKYGSLPVVHDTGGIHDTIDHLDLEHETGNGFSFKFYDTIGLRWAIDEAIRFYQQPADLRARHIGRIMREAAVRFDHDTTADAYIALYEKILGSAVTQDG